MVAVNVMCHGESSAREARAKILVYIYIYIYIYLGSIFQVQGSQTAFPRGVTGAKSHFSWCPVLGAFSGCFRRLQRRVLGCLLESSATLFFGLRAGLCEVCEKVLHQSVLWSEDKTSCIAKTCKPYSTSFKNRRCASDGLGHPRCFPKESILVTKSLIWSFQTRPSICALWHMI